MQLISLSGKIGVGKTAVSNMLMELLPGSVRIAFGDPLKRECSKLYSFPLELCYSEAGKKTTVFLGDIGIELLGADCLTVREVLQKHGMMRRAQDEDYWVKQMREYLKCARISRVPYIINDDCRMPNEADLIREFGGSLYRLQPYPGWKPGKNSDHISETALDEYDGFDMVFCPEKGMEQLQAVAQWIVQNHNQGL